MKKSKKLFGFLLANFGPVILFYVAEHFYDLKTAIIATVIFTICEVFFYTQIRKQKIEAMY